MRDTAEEGLSAHLQMEDLTQRQLHERMRQQAAVASLGQFALSGAGLQDILDQAAMTLAVTLEVEYAKVLELLPDGQALLLRAGVGWREGLVGSGTVGAGLDSQAGYTLFSKGPVIVEDLRLESRFNGPPLLIEHCVVSGMSTIIAGLDGKPYGVLGTHTTQKRVFIQDDIHFLQAVANIAALSIERWHAQRQLALYREVFTNSTDGIAIIGLDGRYVEQNRSHQELTGYSSAELAGQTPEIHLGPAFSAIRDALAETGRFHGEVLSTNKQGGKLDVELSAFAVRDEAGQPAYFVGMKRDITVRKRGLDMLAQSEARYRQLVESSLLAVAVLRDQKIIFANAGAARLVGASSPEQLTGRSVLDFVHPNDREELLSATREARTAGTPTAAREAKLLALDGRVLDGELVSIPFEDQDGPAVQVLVRDITEQKLAENRLRFLLEAGDALSASLDYEVTLREVARLATVKLADWAAVDIGKPGEAIRRLAAVHQDPQKVEALYELTRRYPPNESSGSYRVISSGEPMFVPHIEDAMLVAAARDEEHLRRIRDLRLRSMIIVPLQARGHVLGALTLATAESGRSFTDEDFNLAREIAARAALAIDNARLYQEAEQQRRAAQETAERLQFILRSARVGTWDWDIESGRIQWSDTLEDLHGIAPGTFGGTFQDFQQDMYPEDASRVLEQIGEAVAAQESRTAYEVEYRITHPSGLRWLSARGTVIRDSAGRAIRMAGVCTDVTHRREAEEALRAEQRRLATLVEASPVGVIIWQSATDEILLANPEAGRIARTEIRPGDRMTDISEGLVFRGEDGSILSPDQLPARRAARSGERVRAERLTIAFPDGRMQPILAGAAPFQDEQGATTAVVLLTQDITSLMETERLRNEFLGMVTHELRSPLVVIKSATAMAKDEMLTTTLDSPELLDAIDEQADRMLSLVTNLLDMAQIEAGAFSTDLHPADLREVLEASVVHLSKLSPVPVKLRVPAHLPAMRMDAQRIGQVLNNLLSNAARFAEPGSAIRVEVELEPHAVVVAVRNNGSVITQDKIPLLFNKFTRINTGDGRRASGAGLGLSICKGIIEAHKGAIWAESIEASKETAFYFRLPLEDDERPERDNRNTGEDVPAHDDPVARDKHFRILAVDDEPVVLRYVQNLLRRAGYEVTSVSSAAETPKMVRETVPDLVLLDLMMPEMSGFEVLEQIRTFSDVPVIFLSASDRDEDKVQGLTLGADDYISKPFSTTELAARISAVLRRRHPSGPTTDSH